MLTHNIVFIDLETTGTRPHQDRILEIGLCTVDEGRILEEWSSLVNPQCAIPKGIQDVTGIRPEMVSRAPTFADILEELAPRLAGRLVVAHNARFDVGFLKAAFKSLGLPWENRSLCSLKLSRRLFPQQRRHGLDALISRHHLHCSKRHRALDDARVLWEFVQTLYEELPHQQVDAAAQTQLQEPQLPPQLSSKLPKKMPQGPGVYHFYDAQQRLLYVGKSRNIRNRVLQHFQSPDNSKKSRLYQQTRYVRWEETVGEVGALLREVELIQSQQPVFNRQLRRCRQMLAYVLQTPSGSKNKSQRLQLITLDGNQFRGQRLFGPFVNQRRAQEELRHLLRQHRLCPQLTGLETGSGACFAHQLQQCAGACCGKEPLWQHDLRLLQALEQWQLPVWPYEGAIALMEHGGRIQPQTAIHIVDRWCYLGSAPNWHQARQLLQQTLLLDLEWERMRLLQRLIAQPPAGVEVAPLTETAFA